MKNYILNRFILVFVLLFLGACTQNQEDKTFSIGMVSFAGYAPFYLAQEKGFFGDVDVELKRIDSVPTIRAAVQSGDLDAYLATPDIAQDTDKKPVGVAFWAIDESNGGDGVVVGPNIRNLSDLRGKSIAVEPGLPPYFILQYLLHKNDMSLNDVIIKDLTTVASNTAFEQRNVDAAGLYEPFLSGAANAVDGSKVVISSKDTPGMVIDLIFTTQDALDNDKETLIKIIRGWNKAINYIESNKDESYAFMAKEFGLSVGDFTDIAAGIDWLNTEKNKALFGTDSDGPVYGAFNEVNDVLRRNRATTYKSEAKDFINSSLVDQLK